jgi:hypothetical protein
MELSFVALIKYITSSIITNVIGIVGVYSEPLEGSRKSIRLDVWNS